MHHGLGNDVRLEWVEHNALGNDYVFEKGLGGTKE